MSETAEQDFLLSSRGETWELGAYVVGVAFCRATGIAGFGVGDGTVHSGGQGHQAHKGAVLSLCADVKSGFLTGGDDGKLARTAEATETLAEYGSRWVEHVAAHPDGVRAASVGRALHLLDSQGAALKSLAHPSTVAGIAISRTPSASVSALMYAGGEPIAPASPQPFTPSGLWVHGVPWLPILKFGMSMARGIA